MTLTLDLDAATLDRLSRRARQHGVSDPGAYALELIKKDCDAADKSADADAARADALIAQMLSVKSNGMTADELMELTRSEV